MGTAILIILGIIIGFAVIAFIFSKAGEREDADKAGAMVGGKLIVGLLPTVIVIALVVVIVKSCT